jgi:aspartyl/glutamyl-tRNA(Asn/Gln) amidotransferase C subunit
MLQGITRVCIRNWHVCRRTLSTVSIQPRSAVLASSSQDNMPLGTTFLVPGQAAWSLATQLQQSAPKSTNDEQHLSSFITDRISQLSCLESSSSTSDTSSSSTSRPETQSGAPALSHDVAHIIQWTAQIQQVNTDGIEPLYTPLQDSPLVTRADKPMQETSAAAVLRNATHADLSYFVVPRVVDHDGNDNEHHE